MAGISVFFPVYNNEDTIRGLIEDSVRAVEAYTDDYEIIIINDASLDNSGMIAEDLRKQNDKIKVIHHATNRDYGGALKSGFAYATKDLVFYTDADGQYHPEDLKKLLPLIPDYDMVAGYKIRRNDPFYRVIIGNIYKFLVGIIFGLRLKDVTCDFRLFKREIVQHINLRSNSGFICVELMKEIQNKGYRVAEVGIDHYARQFGRSEAFRLKRIIGMFKDLCVYFIKTNTPLTSAGAGSKGCRAECQGIT